jgi:TPR repeat protein
MHTSCKYFALIVLSVTACFLTACATPPTTAQFKIEFAKGVAAYEAGDYQAARALWQPLADNYDLAALRNLGHLYRLGQGVEKNPQKARRYYEKAANFGHAPSQTNLALMYFAGEGVKADSAQAMIWLKKAAAQGYPPAQRQLAIRTQRFEYHSR